MRWNSTVFLQLCPNVYPHQKSKRNKARLQLRRISRHSSSRRCVAILWSLTRAKLQNVWGHRYIKTRSNIGHLKRRLHVAFAVTSMTRIVSPRISPRVHLDGTEEEKLERHHIRAEAPPTRFEPEHEGNRAPGQPVALDSKRLRRLSFGGGGKGGTGLVKKRLPALDRTRPGPPIGPLIPVSLEPPKFHHGDPRPRLPQVRSPCAPSF